MGSHKLHHDHHHHKKWHQRTNQRFRCQLAYHPSAPVHHFRRKLSVVLPPAPKLVHSQAVSKFAQHVDEATLSNQHLKRRLKSRCLPCSHMRHSVHHHYKLQSADGSFHPLHQVLTRSQHSTMMTRAYMTPSIKVTSDQDSFLSSFTTDRNPKHYISSHLGLRS